MGAHREAEDPEGHPDRARSRADGANHFFENQVDELIADVGAYLDRRLDNPVKRPTPARALKGPSAEG